MLTARAPTGLASRVSANARSIRALGGALHPSGLNWLQALGHAQQAVDHLLAYNLPAQVSQPLAA